MKKDARPGLALILTALLSACGGGDDQGAAAATPLSGDLACGIGNFSQSLLDTVNQARAQGRSCGATAYGATRPLVWSGALTQAAAGHSADMANNNFFSHTGSNGSSADARMRAAGFKGQRTAENITAGSSTVQAAVQQFIDSPSHCAALMSARLSQLGGACVSNGASTYKTYWTLDFGG